MKQLLQYVRTGETIVTEVPAPSCGPRQVLVRAGASLVSAGTERMVVDFAQKNLLDKARSRPDLVRQTIDKARRDGLLTTLEAVQSRLDQPMALGYACAGTVIATGAEVDGLKIGDRVACAGGGYAVHAEIVAVPQTLVAKLPDRVGDEAGTYTTLGAIALQGIRLAEVKLGESVAVIGLGLLGQLTVQMLRAAGCRVAGIDLQPQRADLARALGADSAVSSPDELAAVCQQLSAGRGVDAVLITADTRSNQPVELAGEIARDKGIVVAVGAVGTSVPRKTYYAKELDFRISRSYGPGRYDHTYEDEARDYPYAYVRWTEQRNMQAFVQLLAEGKVNIDALTTHRFPIDRRRVLTRSSPALRVSRSSVLS
jgi:threonine dehydrogenase-like Zn-dependent dehydrogenase